ncbi:MAG: hypothetical protein AAB772_01080, partial [Patescibacteria group bacterium]
IKSHHIVYLLAGGGILLAALSLNNQPLFSNLDQFVLVAEDKILLENNIQVSSGDLASNKEIRIRQNNIINGNLFADNIKIGATSTINGNASFNELEINPLSQILGQTSTLISSPIIKLPETPAFQAGEQDLTITQDQIINPGNFDEIQVQPNITLTLNPGIYNLNKLELENNSKLLFSASTTINIQKELVIKEKILISQTTNPSASSGQVIPSTDLQINVIEDKDIQIGKDSLLSIKLLAPNSQIILKERITFRGQILAREIKVGEGSVLSRNDDFEKESDLTKIIEEQEAKIIVNEIIIFFKDGASVVNLLEIANSIGARPTGFLEKLFMGKLEVEAMTFNELENIINQIKNLNNPFIEEVLPNALIF